MNSLLSKILFFILWGSTLLLNDVYAQNNKERLNQRKQKLQKEIEQTNKLLNTTKSSKQASLNKLIILNNQIQKREKLIKTTNEEIQLLNTNLHIRQNEVKKLRNELETLKNEYAEMLRIAQRNKNSYDRLMFFFASDNFYQAYRRLKYMQQYSKHLKEKVNTIQNKTQELNKNIIDLNGLRQEKNNVLTEQEIEKERLAKVKTVQNSTYNQLQKKEKELLKTLREKEASSRKLQKAIEDIIAREIAEAARKRAAAAKAVAAKKEAAEKAATEKKITTPAETTTTKTPITPATKITTPTELPLTPEEQLVSNNFALNKGKLPWPTQKGTIINSFGEHPHPVLKGIKTKNNGIDIATTPGAKVRAIYEGTVTGVINIPGAGKAIIIRHGEYLSVYSNLENVYVQMGDKVKLKQEIGTVLTDPDDDKTELHFEIWKGKLLLNPAIWVSQLK